MPFAWQRRKTGGHRLAYNGDDARASVEFNADGSIATSTYQPGPPPAPEPVRLKPGDVLKRAIAMITGERPGDCSCGDHVKAMNEKGWWWCWRHRKTIAGWLCESAHKRADQAEEAARQAAERARQARASADAIDPDKAATLLRAAWKEVRG